MGLPRGDGMFLLANALKAVADLVGTLCGFYVWIVVASVIITWVNPDPYNPIVRFLRGATEPVFMWVRRRLPVAFGGIDFAPLVVILVLQILIQGFLVGSLYDLVVQLRTSSRTGTLPGF
jgi:YggT family protein